MIKRHLPKGGPVAAVLQQVADDTGSTSPTAVSDLPMSPVLGQRLENILEDSQEDNSFYFQDDNEESYDQEMEKYRKGDFSEEALTPRHFSFDDEHGKQEKKEQKTTLANNSNNTETESSVFGSLATASNTATDLALSPTSLKQTQLERVLSKAATQLKRNGSTVSVASKSAASRSAASRTSTQNDNDDETEDFSDFDSDTMFNSILDVSTIYSRGDASTKYNLEDDLGSFLSRNDDASGHDSVRSVENKQLSSSQMTSETAASKAPENEDDAIISSQQPPSSSTNISTQIQQALTTLQRHKQVSHSHFQQATQGLEDDLQRAHTLVQTLEEQLAQAQQQRAQAWQRLQASQAKREHQVQAEAVRTMHLQIVQQCLENEVTQSMIEAPLETHYSFADTSTVASSSIDGSMDKVTRLTLGDNSEPLYEDVSTEELQLIRSRLQAILELFGTAQRRQESTNLRWQAQAHAMKQDAASKYILYCRYGQI